jgi:hypothetical protein
MFSAKTYSTKQDLAISPNILTKPMMLPIYLWKGHPAPAARGFSYGEVWMTLSTDFRFSKGRLAIRALTKYSVMKIGKRRLMTNHHYTIDELKTQAKALRRTLAHEGHVISHSKSLETLAVQMGYKDWNTQFASAGNQMGLPFGLGDPVKGTYLGQHFEGEIIGLELKRGQHRYGVTIKFDVPVDVVKFEGMSNFRSRIHAVIDNHGVSLDKTSDGQPHLRIAA